MKGLLLLIIGSSSFAMEMEHKKQVKEVNEVFTPVNEEERNIVLDINDPEVQEIIKKVVSASIHEAFKNKDVENEIKKKKVCCDSSAKVKAALIMAAATTVTGIVTIVLNLK